MSKRTRDTEPPRRSTRLRHAVSAGAAGTRSGTKNAVELSTKDPDGASENTAKRQTTPPGPPEEFTQVDSALMDKHRVALDGGDVLYMPDFLSRHESREWYTALLALDTWYNPTLTLYGRQITQSRAIAVYATHAMPVRYSGADIRVHHPFPPAVQKMKDKVEQVLGVTFNYVLLNRYDGGDVYIGRHSDTRDNGVIASISLGAERTFVMTPRTPPKAARIPISAARARELEKRKSVKWGLDDGSMMVMQGQTQDFWKHEIPREPGVKDGRISLTFRQLV